jgi:hypothetical protein
MAWCKDSVCVAFVGGYSLIKLNKSASNDVCELFSAGIKNEKQVRRPRNQRDQIGQNLALWAKNFSMFF